MDYDEMIQKSIDEIENNLFLEGELNAKALATENFYSPYYYRRIFRAVVGEPVMDYIKKRKLSLAAEEIIRTKTPIVHIALKYGYSTHESFTRAFKACHGVTPKQCRKEKVLKGQPKVRIKKGDAAEMMDGFEERMLWFFENVKALEIKSLDAAEAMVLQGGGLEVIGQEMRNFTARIRQIPQSDDEDCKTRLKYFFRFVKCVSEIAFQSNILAFNAKIEGARREEGRRCAELAVGVAACANGFLNQLMTNAEAIVTEILLPLAVELRAELSMVSQIFDELTHHLAPFENIPMENERFSQAVNEQIKGCRGKIKECQREVAEGRVGFSDTDLSRLVKVAEDVAFTTNILAFNIGIQLAESPLAGRTKSGLHQAAGNAQQAAGKIAQALGGGLGDSRKYALAEMALCKAREMIKGKIQIEELRFDYKLILMYMAFENENEKENCEWQRAMENWISQFEKIELPEKPEQIISFAGRLEACVTSAEKEMKHFGEKSRGILVILEEARLLTKRIQQRSTIPVK